MKYFLGVVIIAFSQFSWSADYEIDVCELQSHTSNAAYLKPCDFWVSKKGCSNDGYISWDMTLGQGKAMYSTALAALTTGKKIKVRLNSGACLGNYDTTTMIRIIK